MGQRYSRTPDQTHWRITCSCPAQHALMHMQADSLSNLLHRQSNGRVQRGCEALLQRERESARSINQLVLHLYTIMADLIMTYLCKAHKEVLCQGQKPDNKMFCTEPSSTQHPL